ncbi:hypothetical protein [Liquorilactobacillus capillatus]|uniref:Uncharacterized protein n=1 Tax=Liquorilactobacillus capillatus DSM 19910 TaxID=1423731 RepID=A0A0R1MDL5_9LACO|nr:hypothetical protein [Liquorilactobacillus capillatus]KRL02379.1 hypothetical protein FC81_GL000722 [Liquorilactobacillus capillatus DSM 19910]
MYYEISEDDLRKIEDLLRSKIKTDCYQTKFEHADFKLPEFPDKEFLKGVQNKELQKEIQKIAANNSRIVVFKAINPNEKNRVFCFTFTQNRANQKWEFSTRIIKGNLTKATDQLETVAFLIGIFNWPILALASGLKIVTVGPSFFKMMSYKAEVQKYLRDKTQA